MCKKCLISVCLLLAALFTACSGTDGEGRGPEDLPDLLQAVPSDALAVCCVSENSDALARLDSTDRLRSLDLNAFRSSPAVLSMSYNGSLVPSLTIGTGHRDSSRAVASALREAGRKGIFAAYSAPDDASGRQGFLTFTASESQMAALKRHIGNGSSVLDAPGFLAAAALTKGENFMVLRNAGARYFLPRGFLGGVFPRRALTSFLHSAADWTILVPDGSDAWRVSTVQGDSDAYFANVMASLPLKGSRLGEVLPDSTDFALSLPLPQPQMRAAYERYIDASVKMTQYERRLAALESASGKDPLKWEQEIAATEIALVRWAGNEVVLLRTQNASHLKGVEDNPYRGFVPALYGDAFALADDSCRAAFCGWYAVGSKEAVEELAGQTEIKKDSGWPRWGCHFVLYSSGRFMAWDKKGMRIWNSNR